VAVRSKACVCGRLLAGFAGLNPTRDMDICLVLSVVCCQGEVSATGRSLVHRGPIDRGVSECDRETSEMRRLCATRAFEP
jgi:hypothetical protein